MGTRISELPLETVPLDADFVPAVKAGVTSRFTWTSIKAFLKTWLDSTAFTSGTLTTMGIAFGGNAVGVTYSFSGAEWQRTGKQIHVNGFIVLTSKGSSTGSATISGLPYTIKNASSGYAPCALRIEKVTFTNQFVGFGQAGTINIILQELTNAGVLTDLTNADFTDESGVMFSIDYIID